MACTRQDVNWFPTQKEYMDYVWRAKGKAEQLEKVEAKKPKKRRAKKDAEKAADL